MRIFNVFQECRCEEFFFKASMIDSLFWLCTHVADGGCSIELPRGVFTSLGDLRGDPRSASMVRLGRRVMCPWRGVSDIDHFVAQLSRTCMRSHLFTHDVRHYLCAHVWIHMRTSEHVARVPV